MLKGINKQIIEIKCTDDEFFEKALLFVRADKADLPQALFAEHSEQLFSAAGSCSSKKKSRNTAALTALLTSAALLLASVLYAAVQLS